MENTNQKFYIGLDSGGTKCDLIIIDKNLKILFSKSYKALHYSVYGAEIISKKLSEYILSSIRSLNNNIANCSGICIGLAGARESQDKSKLRQTFSRELHYKKINIETDTITGLYGAFEGNDGVILISGTGSVLLGKSYGKIYRVGGWGRIIGDYGSGYSIGREALKEVVKEYDLSDMKKKAGLLSVKIREVFKLNKENIVRKVFHENFEIQKVAPLVIECAERKDKASLRIVNDAVEGLLYHIQTFLKIAKRKKPIDLVFIGSIVENNNILSRKLKKEINRNFKKKINIVLKKNSSAYGAALLAQKGYSIKT
ncbi:MAG: hypothetical protein ISS16_10425 [Ignavibacteria bacterium]|nr:hypothetical protein [Bacteroidota bacterium]MBL7129381.1 hypothetical protein [Ignavibacteria bacterium]